MAKPKARTAGPPPLALETTTKFDRDAKRQEKRGKKRFTRSSLGVSKKLENLAAAVALHMAFYNFCWRHGTLRVTPAMAAGVARELWSLKRLIEEVGS
jgi:hypothetical protein